MGGVKLSLPAAKTGLAIAKQAAARNVVLIICILLEMVLRPK